MEPYKEEERFRTGMNTLFIVEGIFLVGTNIALLPAIGYAIYLNLVPEIAILSVVFVVSVVYHLCQVGFICILNIEFSTFQFADQYFVYS